jgi:hypothetical protein
MRSANQWPSDCNDRREKETFMKADRVTRLEDRAEDVPDNESSDSNPIVPTSRPASQDIAMLAHALWEERGCPNGCPEEDWYRAEEIIRSRK